jgi:PEP-CTERM motif-containing protein
MITNSFRSLTLGVCVLAITILGSVSKVMAQPGAPLNGASFVLNFDERGKSLLNGGPNPNPVVLVAGGGIQYFLPGPVTPGQILINLSTDVVNPGSNGDSDLLTFSNAGTAANPIGVLLYESLIDDATETDPADVPRLNYLAPIITIPEIGPEGNNGFQWIAGGATYNGVSDAAQVPEPSTFVLSGLGLTALCGLAYRRRSADRHRRTVLTL